MFDSGISTERNASYDMNADFNIEEVSIKEEDDIHTIVYDDVRSSSCDSVLDVRNNFQSQEVKNSDVEAPDLDWAHGIRREIENSSYKEVTSNVKEEVSIKQEDLDFIDSEDVRISPSSSAAVGMEEKPQIQRDIAMETNAGRYQHKIALIGGQDPYTIPASLFQDISCLHQDSLPNMMYPDICNFLITYPSPYSSQSLKYYKSLDAYKIYSEGHIKNIVLALLDSTFIVKAEVLHSQKKDMQPFQPWIAVNPDGSILCVHCTCMAGLREACLHATALMFAVETGVKMAKKATCTSVEEGKSDVQPPSAQDEDITNPQKKHKSSLHHDSSPPPVKMKNTILPPTDEEAAEFYKELSQTSGKPVILSIIAPYSSRFIPETVQQRFPTPLSSLYSPDHQHLTKEQLMEKSVKIFQELSITQGQSEAVEKETRELSKRTAWHMYGAGRIPSSKIQSVLDTSVDAPSPILIKEVCYPERQNISTVATRWDCVHEATARVLYETISKSRHTNLSISECGLCLSPQFPYLGSSPDGLLMCECCGKGVLEIVCPYCKNDEQLSEDRVFNIDFCVTKNENGILFLKKNHQFYYQVQWHMKLAHVRYCDFVIWTDSNVNNLYIERINEDNVIVNSLVHIKSFYKKCILPELLGKWHTRHPVEKRDREASTLDCWCYCRQPHNGEKMLKCSSEQCKYTLFHFKCLGLKKVPAGNWVCFECRTLTRMEKINE